MPEFTVNYVETIWKSLKYVKLCLVSFVVKIIKICIYYAEHSYFISTKILYGTQ